LIAISLSVHISMPGAAVLLGAIKPVQPSKLACITDMKR